MALYIKSGSNKFSVQVRGDRVQVNRKVRAVGGHRYVLHMDMPIAEFDRLPDHDVLGVTPEWFEFASAMAHEMTASALPENVEGETFRVGEMIVAFADPIVEGSE